MKIGLSFGRCVRDIVQGKVNLDDVLVIISRTNFDVRNSSEVNYIVQHYQEIDWRGLDESKAKQVVLDLIRQGKLHQPRQYGAFPNVPGNYYWLETILPNIELDRHPALKESWDNFQLISSLSGVSLDREAQ